MSRQPRNAETDYEFRDYRQQPPAPPLHLVKYYQRLVVNPFLAPLIVLAALLAFQLLTRNNHRLPLWTYTLGNAVVPLAAYFLLQTHCADCGETQMFHFRSHHACEAVRNRWTNRVQVTTFFLSPIKQLVLWLFSLPILAIVLHSILRREL